MSITDEFGKLVISADNVEPRTGWAYIELVDIDPDLIFGEQEWARRWAQNHADYAPNIIAVEVTGLDIRAV